MCVVSRISVAVAYVKHVPYVLSHVKSLGLCLLSSSDRELCILNGIDSWLHEMTHVYDSRYLRSSMSDANNCSISLLCNVHSHIFLSFFAGIK